MNVDELREKYLSFFESNGHTRCASDVLVPTWDPSVLFTPAGMNPFKDHFLGKVKLDFTRATSCQKCLRTGDIENVGRTAFHHTFFEMLGNFSFGDYFKAEAIRWAWEFCTDKKWLGIPAERLSVTVYVDDDEAANIWSDEIGLPSSRIERMGEDDNFWPAGAPSGGPDGVCGPCSEIFYHVESGGNVEIWNLVFTQFNRIGDPPDNLRPLPSKNIDTGMGLERTAAVLQGVETNFHIDSLRPLVEAAAGVVDNAYDPEQETGRRLRRIADHVRACTFAIHENVYPGPNREKYVVRRLLRRAVLDGHQLGRSEPFLFELVPEVARLMQRPYPELGDTIERVQQVVKQEEQSFFETLGGGLERLERIFDQMQAENRVVIEGRATADLYLTYGIPPELVESMAAERNLTFDSEGYRQAMAKHGEDSGKGQFTLFKTGPIEALKKALNETQFVGYEQTDCEAVIKGIVAQDQLCDQLEEIGHESAVVLVLNRTPFYGEAGGQVGDQGVIHNSEMRFEVSDTQKDGDLVLHYGALVSGHITAGDGVHAEVATDRRDAIRRAHSATHLLHHALQKNLGGHAQQQGSKVDADWLRFDFTSLAALDDGQLSSIEEDVRDNVTAAASVSWQQLPLADARAAGAMMLFGEKYPDPVRMVSIGDFSKELCGGTHLDNSSQVGPFEIISEEGVSAGTRRVVALTGSKAEEHAEQVQKQLQQTADQLGVAPLQVPAAIEQRLLTVRELKKQLGGSQKAPPAEPAAETPAADESTDYCEVRAALRQAARMLNVSVFDVANRLQALQQDIEKLRKQVEQLNQSGGPSVESLLEEADTIGSTKVVIAELSGGNPQLMRQWIDQMRKQASPIAVLLAAAQGDDRVVLVAGFTRDLVANGAHAGNWVRDVAQCVGGSGGGKPDMAQAGGKQPEKLPEALATAREKLTEMLDS